MDEKDTFMKNLANLLKVKTIITITIIAASTAGFLRGLVPVDLYMAMATAIVTYYFTKSDNKGE